jgi:hypothetical protein
MREAAVLRLPRMESGVKKRRIIHPKMRTVIVTVPLDGRSVSARNAEEVFSRGESVGSQKEWTPGCSE